MREPWEEEKNKEKKEMIWMILISLSLFLLLLFFVFWLPKLTPVVCLPFFFLSLSLSLSLCSFPSSFPCLPPIFSVCLLLFLMFTRGQVHRSRSQQQAEDDAPPFDRFVGVEYLLFRHRLQVEDFEEWARTREWHMFTPRYR